RLGTGVRVDDLSDLRVADCLKHELHVGSLAPDVLAEAVGQSDGEVAVARVTDVVLPALERQLNVDGLAGASQRTLDDRIDSRGGSQCLLQNGRVGLLSRRNS